MSTAKFNAKKEATTLAKILDRETAKLVKAENSVWQSVSTRVLTVTIPRSASLVDVKECFDQLGALVNDVSLKTWQTSYKGVLYAIAKHFHSGKLDSDGVKALSGKSIGELKKVLGWGPKPPANKPPANNPPADNPPANNPPADNPPEGNEGNVSPETLPPIGKAPESIKTLNDVYDVILPAVELARDALMKFSESKTKVSRAKAQALDALAQGIKDSLDALAKLLD